MKETLVNNVDHNPADRVRLGFPTDRPLIESVKAAMTEHRSSYRAARSLGIHQDNYRWIRRLLLMRDLRMPQEDKQKIDEALEIIERERVVTRVVRETGAGEVVGRYWQTKKDSPSRVRKKYRRLESTLTQIRESCESTVDMEIPRDLSLEEAVEAAMELSISVEQIVKLQRRLVQGDQT